MNHLLFLAAAMMAQSGVPAANNEVAAQAAAAPASGAQIEADLQAQYQSDLAAYQQALEANHRTVRRNDAHYEHQRRAYADAMAAWRHQVWACHHGSNRACDAPTPNPADFY
jgi:hypothetical protein